MPGKEVLAVALAGSMALACGRALEFPSEGLEIREDRAPMEAETASPRAGIGGSTMVAAEAPSMARGPAPQAEQSPPSLAQVSDRRKVIRHGNVSLEVDSVEVTLAKVKSMVGSLGGYISNESMSEDAYSRRTGSISCRVPAETLDEALEKVEVLGRLENVSITADDITEQYLDLEVRIENQKRLEARLLDLLDRQTTKLSDLLDVERELARVRSEIDQMEGRRRLWDNQVAYSTLVVNIHEPLPAIAGEEGGALRTLLRSFGRAGNNFVLTVAGIVAVSGALVPIAVFAGLVVWIVLTLWRRRKARSG